MIDWKNWAETKLNKALNEPEWLLTSRKKSIAKFHKVGQPTRKQELWKYANTKRLEKGFDIELTEADIELNSEWTYLIISNNNYEVINPNDSIKIRNYKDLKESPEFDYDLDLNRSFSVLNRALMNQGLNISIAKNAELKLHIVYKQNDEEWNVLRLKFDVEANSKLNLKESYNSSFRINQVSQFELQSDSRVEIQSQRSLNDSALLLNHTTFKCHQNADVQHMIQNNQAHFLHDIIDVYFEQQHSQYKAAVSNISANNSQLNNTIHVYHKTPNCKSEIIERSLADDKSQATVNAKATVAVAADGSDIYQSLKNVLLSDDAKIHSKPELEINTDEVIAAHGSTIGELDEKALFYLRSRGIDKKHAKKMLIESFLQEANLFEVEDFLETLNY